MVTSFSGLTKRILPNHFKSHNGKHENVSYLYNLNFPNDEEPHLKFKNKI